MAKSDTVWGIDLGQCALKALRGRLHEDGKRVIAEAFDFIEYPKILSQPGAEPAELVGDALRQFLARNPVRGDTVAISVSGQAGLARFIKLPPVEARKIPDIVRYEARQQIPFDLNDVIWDYQRMGVGTEEEGFALETEIGLFAMKREAVFRTLDPFQQAGIEVDLVQLTPLALYNFAVYDLLTDLPAPDEYDPDNPPGSVVIISIGTDATDLVVTNGYRVWQRNIPLGGNHFTKALTKELKLTFAKAEHLKRNAASAQDPKAVFQAMRPVFNDFLTELQRSIGYFSSLDRTARIDRVVALGNAMKLPGLRRYLSQNLGFEIERVESFRHLVGSQVLAAPAFKENALCFGVCYGLVVQGLGTGGLRTNLLPKEIVQQRLIKRKKPWATAAAASLLLGCAISYAGYSLALGKVAESDWASAESAAKATAGEAQQLRNEAEEARQQFQSIDQIGRHLVANVENRVRWMELIRAVLECLPSDSAQRKAELTIDSAKDSKEEKTRKIANRNELHIDTLECMQVADAAMWFEAVKRWYKPPEGQAPDQVPATPEATPEGADVAAAGTDDQGGTGGAAGPRGPAYIIQLTGHHYHNLKEHGRNFGAEYVRATLIANLQSKSVLLPASTGANAEAVYVTMEELGVSYPTLVGDPRPAVNEELIDPAALAEAETASTASSGTTTARPGSKPPVDATATVTVPRFDFVVQFCWQPVSPAERKEARDKQAQTTADRKQE